jgi:hypothetical protein
MKWTWEDLVQKFRGIMVCPNNIYGHTYGAWLALIHNINIFKLYLDQILFASTHAYGIFRHWADPNSGPAEAQHCPKEYSHALGFSFGFSFMFYPQSICSMACTLKRECSVLIAEWRVLAPRDACDGRLHYSEVSSLAPGAIPKEPTDSGYPEHTLPTEHSAKWCKMTEN